MIWRHDFIRHQGMISWQKNKNNDAGGCTSAQAFSFFNFIENKLTTLISINPQWKEKTNGQVSLELSLPFIEQLFSSEFWTEGISCLLECNWHAETWQFVTKAMGCTQCMSRILMPSFLVDFFKLNRIALHWNGQGNLGPKSELCIILKENEIQKLTAQTDQNVESCLTKLAFTKNCQFKSYLKNRIIIKLKIISIKGKCKSKADQLHPWDYISVFSRR